ncbi:MAG: DUF222 domain-containing protein [Acidimicrobiia bacterium]
MFDMTTVEERSDLLEGDPGPSDELLWQLTEEALAGEPDSDRVVLPPGLDSWLPSSYLAAVVSGVSPRRLSGYDRIILLKATQRLISHFQARGYETMSSVHEVLVDEEEAEAAEFAFRCASAEIRAALHQTAKAANAELNMALDLTDPTYTPVFAALGEGLLDRRRAGLIIHRTSHLDPETAKRVVTEVMTEASGMTSGEIMTRIDQLNMTSGPEEAEARYEQGVAERRVYAEKNWDGTAHYLGLNLAPERVAAAQQRINRIAHHLKTGAESRTMDQLRADIYLDLLTGTHQENKTGTRKEERAQVNITVPLDTLTGHTENPGEIPGWGPVLADTARRIVADQEDGHWQVTVIDPDSGRPLAAVSTRRRPSSHQTRQVQALRPVCAFPGCRNPATDCDLDHNIPWAEDGPTHIDKLAPLCPGDHTIRHHGWTYQINPDGTITWTSRLGHKYTTRPWHPP